MPQRIVNFNYVLTTVNTNLRFYTTELNYVIKVNHYLTTKQWLKKWLRVLYNRPLNVVLLIFATKLDS